MSNRWPGGLIRRTPVTPTGPFQNGAAPGMWTLAEASYWTKQGLWPIAGNLAPVVEDAFSTWLYTGNGSTQTITNGINLSGQGGMVWIKARSSAQSNIVFDTNRGVENRLVTNADIAQSTLSGSLTAFNSNGFELGNFASTNNNGTTYVSWTFRQEPKFFDVVTYTGDGANRTIAHNLGVAPGMILVKRTDTTGDWQVYHRSNANTQYMVLNDTAAVATGATRWNSTTPTATEFSVGTDATVNASGGTYVAYLFAHNTASDGFIQCGSYSGTASPVNLGWEPQWVLLKNSTSAGNWILVDNMRGAPVGGDDNGLFPNLSNAEASVGDLINFTATGFQPLLDGNIIYVAIRRGPMRTPTLGTSVFSPTKQTSTGYTQITGINFAPDFVFQKAPSDGGDGWNAVDKLRGPSASLAFNATGAEVIDTQFFLGGWLNNGVSMGTASNGQFNGYNPNSLFFFRRAPGFFDEVCYTGTGVVRTVNHNLGVAPELMIVKSRSNIGYWLVYNQTLGVNSELALQLNTAADTGGGLSYWNSTAPTSSVISLGTSLTTNGSGSTYVAYLFASAPGVSKVGSYTGNGSSQTINCAFTTGARFVLIKRTNAAGDWYVWDSARGIVAGNDPYLALNSTAAEVTTNDSVDTASTGFVVNQVAASNINVNAATYIFLAIA
jgi:hypothetical protein